MLNMWSLKFAWDNHSPMTERAHLATPHAHMLTMDFQVSLVGRDADKLRREALACKSHAPGIVACSEGEMSRSASISSFLSHSFNPHRCTVRNCRCAASLEVWLLHQHGAPSASAVCGHHLWGHPGCSDSDACLGRCCAGRGGGPFRMGDVETSLPCLVELRCCCLRFYLLQATKATLVSWRVHICGPGVA